MVSRVASGAFGALSKGTQLVAFEEATQKKKRESQSWLTLTLTLTLTTTTTTTSSSSSSSKKKTHQTHFQPPPFQPTNKNSLTEVPSIFVPFRVFPGHAFVALAMVVFLPDSSRVRTCRACGEARRPGSCLPAEPPRQRPEIPEKNHCFGMGFYHRNPINIIGMSTVLYINWWQDVFLREKRHWHFVKKKLGNDKLKAMKQGSVIAFIRAIVVVKYYVDHQSYLQ